MNEGFEGHSGQTGIGTVPGFLYTARLKGDEQGAFSVGEDRAAFDAWVAPAEGALAGRPELTVTKVLWAEGSIVLTTV